MIDSSKKLPAFPAEIFLVTIKRLTNKSIFILRKLSELYCTTSENVKNIGLNELRENRLVFLTSSQV